MRNSRAVSLAAGFALLLAGAGACGLSEGPARGPEPSGAVTTISEAQLGDDNPRTIEEVLRSHAPGLQIVQDRDGDFTFRIRGVDSLTQEQEPLVVIDGVPIAAERVSSAVRGVDPNEIVQVQVLRDVASTSVYGIRGAGGVILIRTRH